MSPHSSKGCCSSELCTPSFCCVGPLPSHPACCPRMQLTNLTSLSLVAKWRAQPTHLPDALAALSGLRQLKLSHGLTQVLALRPLPSAAAAPWCFH